jgi:hypothetical protein
MYSKEGNRGQLSKPKADMPADSDVIVLREFLGEVLATFELITERGDIRGREREALRLAYREFAEVQPPLILDAYREAQDEVLVAAGVIRQQLRSKSDATSASADDLRREADRLEGSEKTKRTYLRKYGIRRWVRRAKVLVETLKGILPPAEALAELLDLLDTALDRSR